MDTREYSTLKLHATQARWLAEAVDQGSNFAELVNQFGEEFAKALAVVVRQAAEQVAGEQVSEPFFRWFSSELEQKLENAKSSDYLPGASPGDKLYRMLELHTDREMAVAASFDSGGDASDLASSFEACVNSIIGVPKYFDIQLTTIKSSDFDEWDYLSLAESYLFAAMESETAYD